MSKESFDRGRIDAAKDSARDSRERAANAIMETLVGSRHYQPPSDSNDKKDYAEGWRHEKNRSK